MSQLLACWTTCPMPDDGERTEQGELTTEQAAPVTQQDDLLTELRRAHLEIIGPTEPAQAPRMDRSVLMAAGVGYLVGGPVGGVVAGLVAQRLAASEAAAPPSAPGQRAQRQGW